MRAHNLEWSVWNRVKAVLNEPDQLLESVNQALLDLEERKSRVDDEILGVDRKLEVVQGKAERLGIAFADGIISEGVYKSKLKQFKQQVKNLLKQRDNLSPKELSDLAMLEEKITLIKEIVSKGNLRITEFGIFGSYGDLYVPVGFNAWRETDGGMAIGDVSEMDSFGIEGTDLSIKGIDAPPGFWECEDPGEREERIKRNMRAILQFFNIKVFVFPDQIEIRGTIPTQVLRGEKPDNADSIAPIIKPPSPLGKGKEK